MNYNTRILINELTKSYPDKTLNILDIICVDYFFISHFDHMDCIWVELGLDILDKIETI